jgi:hypothetical protein
MGTGAMNREIKSFVGKYFDDGRSDLYAAFLLRNLRFLRSFGFVGMITIPNWMFLPSFEQLRAHLCTAGYIQSMLHNGRGVWGGDFGSCSFIIAKSLSVRRTGIFRRLFKKQGEIQSNAELEENFKNQTDYPLYKASSAEFRKISGAPIAYWASLETLRAFQENEPLSKFCFSDGPCKTGCDDFYLRYQWEVENNKVGEHNYWCRCSKGGAHRKFYGNIEHVIRWSLDVQEHYRRDKIARITPDYLWGRQGITWTIVSAKAEASFRLIQGDTRFNSVYPSIFLHNHTTSAYYSLLAFLNSKVANHLLSFLNPTLALNVGNVLSVPVRDGCLSGRKTNEELCEVARADWDNFETSWDFRDQPLLRPGLKAKGLEASWRNWEAQSTAAIVRMQELETENNQLFIAAYGLDGELQPEVPEEQITLARADVKKDMAAFLSFAVGCMMGRYGLDHPGLILANAGDTLENYNTKVGKPLAELTFAPDPDGIIPVLDGEWFEDDIVARSREFLAVTFSESSVVDNLRFIEDSLGKDIRKY